MARQVRDAKLETRAARARLTYQRAPYRRLIEEGLHLTYRKVKAGSGTWGFRAWTGERYREATLGTADDFADADGVVVLTFSQAQAKAVARWRAEQHRAITGAELSAGPYTVADALRDYETVFVAKGGKATHTIRSISAGYILPALSSTECEKLTKATVSAWFANVASTGRLVRTRKGVSARVTSSLKPDDADAQRRRRSTANRVLTVLKAALNHAHREGKISSDTAWRMVKPFRSVDGVRVHYLTPAEASRLINACDPEFRAIVRGALLTGCRYGELCRLKVADVNLEAGSILIRESKSGHPRHIPLNAEGVEHFRAMTLGKTRAAFVFTKNGEAWKSSEQGRPMLAACKRASIDPPITFHGMRDTYASSLVMSGAPIEVVAKLLGHSDSRITAKHYAHLAPSYVADVLRNALPRFASPAASNVVALSS